MNTILENRIEGYSEKSSVKKAKHTANVEWQQVKNHPHIYQEELSKYVKVK